MKRTPKQIAVGFAVGVISFVVVCGVMKATLSTSTFHLVNAIWAAAVLITWLVWSFRGHFQYRHAHAGATGPGRPAPEQASR